MFDRLHADVRAAVSAAEVEATTLGAARIEPEHLLLGVLHLDGPVPTAMKACGLQPTSARRVLDGTPRPSRAPLPFSAAARAVLEGSLTEALRSESGYVGPAHLLLACLAAEDSCVARLLTAAGTTKDALRLQVEWLSSGGLASPGEARAAALLAQTFGS
jgi:ATP-dependent Clp protease ATP-binding subunit ClpA